MNIRKTLRASLISLPSVGITAVMVHDKGWQFACLTWLGIVAFVVIVVAGTYLLDLD